jgi:hypothetical protein
MARITITQETEVAHCDCLDAAALQLRRDSDRDILIEIEANSRRQRAAPLAPRRAESGCAPGRRAPACVRSSRPNGDVSDSDGCANKIGPATANIRIDANCFNCLNRSHAAQYSNGQMQSQCKANLANRPTIRDSDSQSQARPRQSTL